MLKNYLKIAWRNLLRRKGFTAINVMGLAIGIACCLLIFLFVRSEWSFDRFHEEADRIHRAWVLEDYGEGRQFFNTVTPYVLGPRLEADFPEVETTVRVGDFQELVRRGATQFTERIHYADADFFEVFDFPLVRGAPEAVLGDPGNVVLTEALVERYFGGEDPLGQALTVRVAGEERELTVTGIAANPPTESSIQFAMLLPFELARSRYSENAMQSWHQVYGETYVLLQEDTGAEELEAKLPSMVQQVVSEQYRDGYTVGLQPITDIHLNPEYPSGLEPVSDPAYSYILSAIALLVLLIACINFVTLSLSRSAERAKEIGVRKAVGSQRWQVAGQFYAESLLLAAGAVLLGLFLARGALPFFNTVAGRELSLSIDPLLAGGILLLLLLVGIGAGSYPALVLSSFHPAEVLRGRLSLTTDRSLLRRGLVVFQFTLAIFLIGCTLVMQQQLDFLQTKPLGFDKEQVVVLRTSGGISDGFRTYDLLRGEISGRPEVAQMAASTFSLGGEGWMQVGFDDDDGRFQRLRMNVVSHDFVETMGIEMAAGRSFSREIPSDTSRGILVNEALVRTFGWDEPIGQQLPGSSFPDHEVIGVVEDFHFASLHEEVAPLVLAPNFDLILDGVSDVSVPSSPTPKIALRLSAENLRGTMNIIERNWERVAADQPFDYVFLDEAVDSQYRAEERLGRIVRTASGLAIFIACLGLFGLAALATVRRTKEIGVRKALGASARSIVGLLTKDFAKLVAVAFVLATPVAYWAMQRWLEDFAYRIEPGLATLALAGLAALGVALLTVSYHALRAATTNPTEALRQE